MFPLTTLSDWGWHSSPYPGTEANSRANRTKTTGEDEGAGEGESTPFSSFEYTFFNISTGRKVPYPLDCKGEDAEWLRANPHRLDLIQVAASPPVIIIILIIIIIMTHPSSCQASSPFRFLWRRWTSALKMSASWT